MSYTEGLSKTVLSFQDYIQQCEKEEKETNIAYSEYIEWLKRVEENPKLLLTDNILYKGNKIDKIHRCRYSYNPTFANLIGKIDILQNFHITLYQNIVKIHNPVNSASLFCIDMTNKVYQNKLLLPAEVPDKYKGYNYAYWKTKDIVELFEIYWKHRNFRNAIKLIKANGVTCFGKLKSIGLCFNTSKCRRFRERIKSNEEWAKKNLEDTKQRYYKELDFYNNNIKRINKLILDLEMLGYKKSEKEIW